MNDLDNISCKIKRALFSWGARARTIVVNRLTPLSHKPLFRIAIGIVLILCYELLKNWKILDRFTCKTFTALALPYLLYFVLWFILFWKFKKTVRAVMVSIIASLVLWIGALPFVYAYYYQWLPMIDIVFFGELTPGRKMIFEGKVLQESILIIVLVLLEYLFWNRLLLYLQNKELQSKLSRVKDSRLLSAHAIPDVMRLLDREKKPIDIRIINFLSYVFDRIDLKAPLVALDEEWQQVLALISIYKARSFKIEGEQYLSGHVGNRSFPALVLLTFLTNALHYSPENAEQPILLRWQAEDGHLIFYLRNAIAPRPRGGGAGQGLKLVSQLLEDTYGADHSLSYGANEANTEFFVCFTLKL